MPARRWKFGVLAAALAVGGLTVALAATALAPSASAAVVTRQLVIDRTLQLRSEVLRADRIEAKLTTWAALQRAEGSGDKVPQIAPSTSVFVVAVGGNYRTAFGHGQTYPWGVIVYDAVSGRPIASFANDDASWPAFFDRIVDLAP